ncbi:hypothetical protein C1T31_07135 [Hanstruepera neustonica]|uniref:Glycosyl transferase family 1 domain-containing protein n=1 Tax=Hanstruepera neustonica TaxID=1445657 RepID=A0A2K1DZ35_9FLAO|nr:glycosyltransferase family 4 protein [Hanstruepera neustonica]PNQ73286.1 hypothetical protein C1T31_07135 [Hanstruepera neustonica]
MSEKGLKIEWLTKSNAMKAYFEGDRTTAFTGGTLYEIDAIKSIITKYPVSVNFHFVKTENIIKYLYKNHVKTIQSDICVVDPFVLACNKLNYDKYNIAMIHHIDESIAQKSIFGKLFLKRLKQHLKKVDLVIVVSKYWKDYVDELGVKKSQIIYNSYNLDEFRISEEQRNQLKEKLQLDPAKPTIYLGKLGKGKGVEKVMEFINVEKYNLIATGKNDSSSNKYKSVFLSRHEFPILLDVADIVLAMSTMPEGWNRIAHEALLMKTPVIGSGSGGMMELLQNSGQKIVHDLTNLNMAIENGLNHKDELGVIGYSYVKQFDSEYFKREWLDVIDQIKPKL